MSEIRWKYLIGIDEAGRGPLAGPVSVGVVCIQNDFNWEQIPGVTDSKVLSPQKREALYKSAVRLKKEKKLWYAVHMVGSSVIDRIGIVPAVSLAMKKALVQLHKDVKMDAGECFVKLDGSLRAPQEFIFQETIIKGDAKEKIIGLASILAKVTRDRHMVRIAKRTQYAAYGFDVHKGYGTKVHIQSIKRHGLSTVHRKSFCSKLVAT